MQPSPLRPLLLLAAASHAFIGPAPPRCRVSVASDRDGAIDDADEAARVAAFRARLLKGGLDAVAKDVEPTEEDDGDVQAVGRSDTSHEAGRVQNILYS